MPTIMRLLAVASLSVAALDTARADDGPKPAASDQLHSLIQSACEIAQSDLHRGFPQEGLRVIEAIWPVSLRADVLPVDRARLAIARGELEHYRASLAGASEEQAILLLRSALATAEASGDASTIGRAADMLGLVVYAQAFENGDFDAAVPHLERALAIRRRMDDRRGIAETLFHLGLIHQNRRGATENDRGRAQELYLEALPITLAGDFQVEQSYLERHIAAEEEMKGNLDAALAGFDRSLALRQQAGYRIYLAPALLAVGGIHAARNEAGKALARYREALAIAREIGASRYVVQSYLELAALAEKQGDRQTAIANGRLALEAAHEAGYIDGVKEAAALLKKLGSPSS